MYMFSIDKIIFRKLEERDLQLLHDWLNTDFIMKWYGKKTCSYDEIFKKYIPRIKGEEPTGSFFIVYENKNIGYIQTYMLKDYPEYNKYVEADEFTAGLDLFIGEKDFLHKGFGKSIIIKFLNEVVFVLNNAESCVLGPEPKNTVAIRAYEKVGFKYLRTIRVPDEDEPEYLMQIYKCDINAGSMAT
ncbi:MAG: hypothetical protein C0412_19100 [Flavobacterium sp.]|nr:hypothetical protein [Flavobacterium sp.]